MHVDAAVATDIEELYGLFSKRLEQIVRADVRQASAPVVEDACQFAWDRLIHNHPRVRRDTALWWLAATAVHEAFKLLGREQRSVTLDAALDVEAPSAHELVERRERIKQTRRLPQRQQRLVWLHALGLSYVEIALQTGLTTRTIERQIRRARQTLRAAV